MPYIYKTVYTGDVIEKYKIFSGRYGIRKTDISARTEETKKQAKAINTLNAEKHLRWLLNTNFKEGDIYCTLTYQPSARPDDRKTARKDITNYIKRLKRKNPNIKYIYTSVCGKSGKAPHHHLVISGMTAELLQECWGDKGRARSTFLYKHNGVNDYTKLASYLIKQTELDCQRPKHARRYIPSKNLAEPRITRRIVSAKKWRDELKAPKGYYELERENYDNDIMSLSYSLWRFAKLNC